MTTVTVNGLGQFNNTIQSHDVGDHLVAAFLDDQPGSVVNVNGIGNVVDKIDSPGSIIRLTGNNNVATTFSADTMVFLNGVGNSALITRPNDTVSVLGACVTGRRPVRDAPNIVTHGYDRSVTACCV